MGVGFTGRWQFEGLKMTVSRSVWREVLGRVHPVDQTTLIVSVLITGSCVAAGISLVQYSRPPRQNGEGAMFVLY
jgi:hypothetical protein